MQCRRADAILRVCNDDCRDGVSIRRLHEVLRHHDCDKMAICRDEALKCGVKLVRDAIAWPNVENSSMFTRAERTIATFEYVSMNWKWFCDKPLFVKEVHCKLAQCPRVHGQKCRSGTADEPCQLRLRYGHFFSDAEFPPAYWP